MSESLLDAGRVLSLAETVCDQNASDNDYVELDAILGADAASRRRYWDYCRMHVALEMEMQSHEALHKAFEPGNLDTSALTPWETEGLMMAAPAAAPTHFPVASLFPTTLSGPLAYFSSEWSVAYLVATVVTALGLLIGSVIYVSEPVQVVRQSAPVPSPLSPLPSVVGRITGMVDCKWEQNSEIPRPKTQGPRPKTLVALGDTFALASGLLEITYNTGAKVILQGPVTYEVESRDGGYLALGKLTAKLEKRSAVSGQQSEIINHKSEIPNPSLSTNHYPLFTIKTPTAVVTDLGTEFGVEVNKAGHTTSHVFRGTVEVRAISSGGHTDADAKILHADESAEVTRSGGSCRIVLVPTFAPSRFVRQISKPTIKSFDLVDVVAGGDGFSGRRNRGIDPTSGRPVDTPPNGYRMGDGKYHRALGLPFVDGVFIPDGRIGPVQLDSAGHTFADFPHTDNGASGDIWAGGAIPTGQPAVTGTLEGGGIGRTALAGIEFASAGHGLLAMHANKGITFDLEAIRRANPGWKPLRFCAVAGNTETATEEGRIVSADLWVFVDGVVRRERREINRSQGALWLVIPLAENSRFLTLAATDSGNTISTDWIVFGDPRLEMAGTSGAREPQPASLPGTENP